jgi:hypothetical protein
MDPMFTRILENMEMRVSGPLKFRLFLQPTMAVILGVMGGLKDARMGRPPYFWGIFTIARGRRAELEDGWRSIWRVFILAIVLDIIFQLIVLKWVYPGETILVALILAIIPYVLVRGPVNRIASRLHGHAKETKLGS